MRRSKMAAAMMRRAKMTKADVPAALAKKHKWRLLRQRGAFRRGFAKMTRYAKIAAWIDRFLTAASRPLGMCQERRGAHFSHWNKFSRRFAKFFYTECPCCLFWRGVTAGAALSGGVCAVLAAAFALLLRHHF